MSISAGETAMPAVPQNAGGPKGAWRGLRRPDRIRRLVQGQGLLLMLVALSVYFASRSEFFLTSDNFFTIGSLVAALGIMAVAQTFLIVSGGFDVSVGSIVALSGVIIGQVVKGGDSVWLGAVLAILAGGLVGALNGFIIVNLGVNSLIATLGTLSIFSGLAFTLTGGETLIVGDEDFAYLGSGYVGAIPFCFLVFLGVLVLGLFVERYTAPGRAVYAIGGNPEAARLAGLRTKLVPFTLYVVSGLSGGLAGVIVTSQLGAASPQVGSTYLLSVVTAVILGGASLAGGRGSLIGTLIAVFILGVLQNGFALLSLSSYSQTVALGVALIVAVLLDQSAKALEERGAEAPEDVGSAPPGSHEAAATPDRAPR